MPGSLVHSMDLRVQRGTAAQRALAIPEILNNIFMKKGKGDIYFTHTDAEQSDLLQWALVNKYWYAEAIRLLWAHPMSPIDRLMARIPPDRRQYYANFVTWVQVVRQSQAKKDHFEIGGPLHGITFPKLTRLFVSIFTNDLYVIPVDHPDDWARDMYFKKREPKFEEECHLDSILQIISKFIPGVDELFLRYEGPVSNLTGMVEFQKRGVLPAGNTHWYIDESPDSSTDEDEDKNLGYFEEPKEVVVDNWGESTWADTYLCQFDTKRFNLTSSSWNAVNAN